VLETFELSDPHDKHSWNSERSILFLPNWELIMGPEIIANLEMFTITKQGNKNSGALLVFQR
jgi:hypothetical protein